MSLAKPVTIAALLESAVLFYWVHCFTDIYRRGHAPWSWVLLAGWPASLNGLLLMIFGFTYLRFAKARLGLTILAIAAPFYGAFTVWNARYLVKSFWGVFDGDLVAISVVVSIGLVVIGLLAAADRLLLEDE